MRSARVDTVDTDIPLLRFLPPDMRALLVASFERGSVTAGAILLEDGATADALYIVLEGRLCASDVGDESNEVPAATLGPGDAFGRVGSLAGTTCTGAVRASSNVELLRLDSAAFDALLDRRPELRQQLERRAQRRLLSDRLRQFTGPVLQAGAGTEPGSLLQT